MKSGSPISQAAGGSFARSPGAESELGRQWRQGKTPTIEDFLAEWSSAERSSALSRPAVTARELAALVSLDQRERWRRGERPSAEAYLQQFPQLAADDELALDVIYGEFLLREELGELTDVRDFQTRFSEFADTLLDQIEFHRAMAKSAEPAISERPGTQIGPYKLLQQMGEGGFGIVFMAEQTEPVRRRVALKVIKPGMDTRQVIARFEAERQALAVMDHPHIAHVLDAGTTESGRPYFVMELVRGLPITQYCDENQLSIRERLELFATICQAIQHAHTKGIIHRDIKPTNVLVTRQDGQPVVKVIDFGVAKAMGQQLTDKTLFTEFAQMIGTPLYMSPEQAELSSTDIDTRSDIYSLGVLLYELLTGTTPVSKEQLKQAAFDEIRRIIREDEPQKPSTRISTAEASPSIAAQRHTEPTKLTKLVRGELDWIVMKALEKDRSRRYETATGFAKDIEHYLNDDPVLACPPSAAYRFRKFARRHKAALAALVAIGLALLVAIGGVAGGIGWAVRDRAGRQAAVEQEVNLALKEAGRLQEQGQWPEALSSAKRAEGLLAGGGSDELRERVRQLRKDVEMVLRLEEIRLLSSQWKDHKFNYESADRAYTLAFDAYGIDVTGLPVEEAAARIRARPAVADELVAALDYWSDLRRQKDTTSGMALRDVAKAAESNPRRRQVREAEKQEDKKALASLAASPDALRQPPTSLLMLTLTLRYHGLVEAQIDLLRRAQRQYPGDFWINYELAVALHAMGPSYRDEAISFFRAAVAARPNSSAALSKLAEALREQEKLDEAIAICRKAIELDPNINNAHWNIVMALQSQGKLDEAIAWYTKAIELNPSYALGWSGRGLAHLQMGQLDEALADQTRAIELDPKAAIHWNDRSVTYLERNEPDKALADCAKAIELDSKYARPWFNRGEAYRQLGQQDRALAEYSKALELEPSFALTWSRRGLVHLQMGQLDKALADLTRAIELDPKSAIAYHDLGNALMAQKKLDEAIAAYRKAIEIDPKDAVAHNAWAWLLATCPDPNVRKADEAVTLARKGVELGPKNAAYWNTLGVALYRAGDWKEALAALDTSMELPGGGDAHDWFFVAMSHCQLRNKDEARKWYDKAVEWMQANAKDNEELNRFRAEAEELMKKE
ncbi:MAG TPA: tetratricopeptide repeat protein [Pirellulaceae bacterium]|nr:tetratricopeptide repeat protein [Pirellulaceae bacterium]